LDEAATQTARSCPGPRARPPHSGGRASIGSGAALHAAPSLPAALHYLQRSGVVRVWNANLGASAHGYAYYFTVLERGGHYAHMVKVCESRRGRVTGSTNLSAGEPDCEG